MIKLTDLYAEPGHAPKGWQVMSNDDSIYGAKPPIKNSPDLERVLALPRREQVLIGSTRGAALVRMMNARFGRVRTDACECQARYKRECILSLNLTQAWALYEIGTVRGLVGPIGVGHGKTILDLLAVIALAHGEPDPGKYEAALLVPPNLVDQLISEYLLVGEHFVMPTMSIVGRDDAYDAGPGMPTLHVIPYSRLQRPEATVLLETLRPSAIIADEAHSIRNADAVRTDRVLRYYKNHPDTLFACWTGSITDSSIKDYAHLSDLALRDHSPVPRDPEVAKEWASALDPKSEWPAEPGALLEGLIASGCQLPGEHVHAGFHRRLIETEGFVATRSSAIAAELGVSIRHAPDMPDEPVDDDQAPGGRWPGLATLLATVRETGVRPDGEILLDPLQVSRCCRELACGFFYRWIYPHATDEDLAEGGLIDQWFEARKRWRRELRDQLKNRQPHMDSPFLCQLAAMRAHGDIGTHDVREVRDEETGEISVVRVADLPVWAAEFWPAWRDIRDRVEYETEAVWISDYLARDAVAWLRENRGVVWYDKSAFGAKVAELAGLPLYGGGPDAGPRLIGGRGQTGTVYPGEDGTRSVICSIKSHGTGRDGLQRLFSTQLIANPPSSATTWEQLLGRLHRIGQPCERVDALFYCHTDELAACYAQARARAAYVQATIGANQKLNGASEE